jgi:hypothetical protein
MSYFQSVKLIDTAGVAQGIKIEEGAIIQIPYDQAISQGLISGDTAFAKYGRCTCSNSAIDVWEGNSVYAFPASATTLDVISSDTTNDVNTTGTGLWKVKIEGLKSDYTAVTEEVTLAGTATTTTNSFLRINKMYASAAGTNGVAAGTITAKIHSGSTVYAQISAGLTQSRQLIYTVPLGKTLYITSIAFSSGVGNASGPSSANFVIFTTRAKVNPADGTASTIFYPYNEIGLLNQSFYRELEFPTKIPATADLKISCKGDVALSVQCVAAIRGWLE